jgi:hypothetical protein
MKNYFLLLLIIVMGQTIHAQIEKPCISGPLSIELNQTGIYSVNSSLGQCSNCYDWDVSPSSIAQIVGSDQGSSVSIRRISSGDFTISVTYLNENGCSSCEIDIIENCIPPKLNICQQFTSVAQNGDLILQLSQYDNQPVRYVWNATYHNNTTATYDSANPPLGTNSNINYFSAQFPATVSNPIKSVTVTSYKLGCPRYLITSNDYECSETVYAETLGFGKSLESSLIYPNPANGVIRIIDNSKSDKYKSVRILNLSGMIKLEIEITKDKSIDISSLEKGVYIVQLINYNNDIFTEKLLVH